MAEELTNFELQMLLNNKETGFNYREPRHEPWRENYELYRDKVTINRLTQRQSVNLPLMKTTLRTLLKDIDDMPVVVFENLDNDKEAEVFQNEYWKWTLEGNNAELQDIVDKKQDFFFGRTFDSWQVADGMIKFEVEDPEDMLVDRFMNPHDLNSSRFLIHTHIFKPLTDLERDPNYDQKEVKRLKLWFETDLGIIKQQDNQNSLQQKNQKMADMGVTDIDDPLVGETIVELTMHRVFRPEGEEWTDKEGKKHTTEAEQIFHYIEAEEQTILTKMPQEEIIGTTKDHWWRNHYNYHTWGDDVDKQDFWTDGIADIARTPNKIENTWFSQLVENRTLRSFGMHYYDSTLKSEGFTPSTWQPIPWGWYAVPGKPSDVLQKVDIPDLSESLDEMGFLIEMLEKATGSTATQQGAQTETKTTLGEVQLALGEAKARAKGISKFYTAAWKQRAVTFLKLIEAAGDKLDAVKIYKKGRNTDDIFAREIEPKDWMTKTGYKVRVWSQDEKDSRDTQDLQRLNALKLAMPDNPKVSEIYTRKLAEYADLTPEEVTEIMDFEKQKQMMMLGMQNGLGGPMMPGQTPTAMPMQNTMPPVQPNQLLV